jgi:hypothetical protein
VEPKTLNKLAPCSWNTEQNNILQGFSVQKCSFDRFVLIKISEEYRKFLAIIINDVSAGATRKIKKIGPLLVECQAKQYVAWFSVQKSITEFIRNEGMSAQLSQ